MVRTLAPANVSWFGPVTGLTPNRLRTNRPFGLGTRGRRVGDIGVVFNTAGIVLDTPRGVFETPGGWRKHNLWRKGSTQALETHVASCASKASLREQGTRHVRSFYLLIVDVTVKSLRSFYTRLYRQRQLLFLAYNCGPVGKSPVVRL